MDRNRGLKVLGLASVVGVLATGALVARDERSRRAYSPEEVRDRLRQRLETARPPGEPASGTDAT